MSVHDDLDPPQRLKTLAHEWAHVQLNHADANLLGGRHVAEVEAESVAFLLMGTVGIDTTGYTIPYVSGWSGGNPDLVRATAEHVLAATGTMIGRLEQRLDIDLTPDPLTRPDQTVDDHPVRHLHLVTTAEPETGGLSPWQRLLDTVRATLTDNDRVELAHQPAPRRVAVLLAAAGFDADTAVTTMRDLGVNDRVAREALTAVVPVDGIGDPPGPLYRPAAVMLALTQRPATSRHPSTGRELIAEWARVEQPSFVLEPMTPHPPVA